MFKTPAPFKDFAKKIKRQSLLYDKRRSMNVALDADFLQKLKSIPDPGVDIDCQTDIQPTETTRCVEKQLVCKCGHKIRSTRAALNLETNSANAVILSDSNKCSECGVPYDVADLMFIYGSVCKESFDEINDVTNRISELEKQLEDVQREFTFCRSTISKVSQQRDISKRIMATVVTMMS